MRSFTAADWEQHKPLAAAIVHAKKEYILTDSAGEQTRQGVDQLVSQLKYLHDG